MFGKGNGALGMWIKEFCEIVFIQTLQAFIYALVIGLIVKMNVASMSGEDAASTIGFMCVICLTAIFKVEEILRRILGFGHTKADHGNAVKSIAKTAFAMKLGKRVLDNGNKLVGGTKKMISANKDAKKAVSKLDRRLTALKRDNGIDEDSDENLKLPSDSSTVTLSGLSQRNEEKTKLSNEAAKLRKMAQMETDPSKKKDLMDKSRQKAAQARAIDGTLKDNIQSSDGLVNQNTNILSQAVASENSTSTRSKNRSGNFYQALLNLEEQYEKELSDAKKKRKEGFRTMTKGVAETAGAVIGGAAGGVLGFADGNIEEGLSGMVSGAGIGDAIGTGVTNTVYGTKDFVTGSASVVSKAVKDYSKNIASQYEQEKTNAMNQMEALKDEASRTINNIDKDAEKARNNLQDEVNEASEKVAKNIENSVKGNATIAAKSVVKGSVKAYNSRHGGIRQLNNGLKDLERHINNASKNIDNNIGNNVESID